MKSILLLLPLLLLGCRNPGVVQLGPDTYLLSRNSKAGAFVNMPALKAEVIRDAQQFAATKGKRAETVSLTDTFPAHGFPSVDYQFRLVEVTNAPAAP